MIGLIEGRVAESGDDFLIVLTGGVGYKVFVSKDTLEEFRFSENPVRFWTYLAVRETALDLYGFPTEDDLSFFELLLNVPGIGPKSALSILNIAPTNVLAGAISAGDASYLTKVSGIGKKSADKIVLELRDKVAHLGSEIGDVVRRVDHDAIEALKSLGYSMHVAREALKEVPQEIEGVQERIREALKILANRS
jgi:holliday junction DNA helicase RuvA